MLAKAADLGKQVRATRLLRKSAKKVLDFLGKVIDSHDGMGSSEITTLNELFLKAVAKHSKPDCFLFKSEGRYQGLPSQEALRQVAALASLLSRLHVERGDRVAILSENRVEWALTDYALLGLGAISVPIYTTLLEPDIEYILRDSGAKGIVVATEPQLAKVVNVWPHLPDLKFVLAMDCAKLQGTGAECWEGSIALERGLATNAVESFTAKALAAQPEDIATILYTSGTMGEPKGVILTHANIVSNVLECAKLFPLTRNDAGISLLPLSHILERMLDFLCFWTGVSIAYAESLDALPLNLREVRPTLMGVVPRVLEKIRDRVMEVVRAAPPARQKIFYWALGVGKQAFPYRLKGQRLPLALRLKHAIADRLIFSKVREQLGGRITDPGFWRRSPGAGTSRILLRHGPARIRGLRPNRNLTGDCHQLSRSYEAGNCRPSDRRCRSQVRGRKSRSGRRGGT